MEYYKEMRQLVGHRPLHLVGSGVILYRGDRILLQIRADDGKYGKHGGIVDIRENTEDALRRELREEIGLEVGKVRLFGVYSGPQMTVSYPNGDVCNYVDVVYVCDDFPDAFAADGYEVSGLEWFDIHDMPDAARIHPTDRGPILDFVSRRLKGERF